MIMSSVLKFTSKTAQSTTFKTILLVIMMSTGMFVVGIFVERNAATNGRTGNSYYDGYNTGYDEGFDDGLLKGYDIGLNDGTGAFTVDNDSSFFSMKINLNLPAYMRKNNSENGVPYSYEYRITVWNQSVDWMTNIFTLYLNEGFSEAVMELFPYMGTYTFYVARNLAESIQIPYVEVPVSYNYTLSLDTIRYRWESNINQRTEFTQAWDGMPPISALIRPTSEITLTTFVIWNVLPDDMYRMSTFNTTLSNQLEQSFTLNMSHFRDYYSYSI